MAGDQSLTHIMLNTLYRFVPEKPFGISFSDADVTVVQLAGSMEHPRLRAIGKANLPKGVVENGELLREKELASIVSHLLHATTPFKITTKKCWAALPERQVFEHIFCVPDDTPEREFKIFLEERIEETIPFPLHEMKYDSYVFDSHAGKAVFVAAARKLIIAQYYEVLKELCGLIPLGIEPESLSFLRNIPVNFSSDSGMLLVHSDGDAGKWFLLWREHIFDSNDFLLSDFFENSKHFLDDVKKSMERFSSVLKKSVTSIVLSGGVDFHVQAEDVVRALGLPICVSDDHLVNIHALGNERERDFQIAAGLALKIFDNRLRAAFDLFKK